MNEKIEYRMSWTRHLSDGGFRTSKGDSADEVVKQMEELDQLIRYSIFSFI